MRFGIGHQLSKQYLLSRRILPPLLGDDSEPRIYLIVHDETPLITAALPDPHAARRSTVRHRPRLFDSPDSPADDAHRARDIPRQQPVDSERLWPHLRGFPSPQRPCLGPLRALQALRDRRAVDPRLRPG